MSIQNFIPTIWTAAIMQELEGTLLARQLSNLQYEQEIQRYGDTLVINGLIDPTVTAYTAADIVYEDNDDAGLLLKIDQKFYVAFNVDDIDAAQANANIMDAQAQRTMYKLRKNADGLFFGQYAKAQGGTVTDATADTASILSDIGNAAVMLDNRDVPEGNRWLTVSPWVKMKLRLAGVKFQIKNGTNASNGVEWAQELGFDIYVSNNLTTSGTFEAPNSKCLAGSYQSIAYADQIVQSEALRLEKRFADGFRALHVFGMEVVKPKELVLLDLTGAAETTI